ncbi:hypothetical protein EOJ36_04975 [Sandaracinomonas limnophila]|uniref:Uncharacterized protein n=1 Tax=Sandaracinomonas limnophila TaxID=1862386 RepID=A0A437PU40_9BACT|nr:hypothetical protein [Sandaracinomonas limnophila]RVU25773.1 hypothetical protein EOJ36_04975 [Sandaracinomonas limnophila]
MNFETESVQASWEHILNFLEKSFGKRPSDVDSVLFLIGIQELGQGPKEFSKEEKQDLMHIATCKVLSYSGFYQLIGSDSEGWPHWDLIKPVPSLPLKEQEILIKSHIIHYFTTEIFS